MHEVTRIFLPFMPQNQSEAYNNALRLPANRRSVIWNDLGGIPNTLRNMRNYKLPSTVISIVCEEKNKSIACCVSQWTKKTCSAHLTDESMRCDAMVPGYKGGHDTEE